MQTPLNELSHPIYFATVAVATLIPSARDNPQNYVSSSRIYICFFFNISLGIISFFCLITK